MLAVPFEGSRPIAKPPNMTDEECSSLEVYQGFAQGLDLNQPANQPFTVSYWMPSKEDIEAFQQGRGVWVRILSHIVFPIGLFTLDEKGEINQ